MVHTDWSHWSPWHLSVFCTLFIRCWADDQISTIKLEQHRLSPVLDSMPVYLRRNISQTFWHQLPIFQVDLHCVLHRVATSSCRGHVDKLATEPFLLLHHEHGTGYRRSSNCCDRRTCFVVIWKHFCFILSTGSRRAPGYRLTLWCVLSLLVQDAIQVPHLQLQSGLKVRRYAPILRTGTSEKSLRQYRHLCQKTPYSM